MLAQESRFVAEEARRINLQVLLALAGDSRDARNQAVEVAKSLIATLAGESAGKPAAATVEDVAKYKQQYQEMFGIDVDNPAHAQELDRRIEAHRASRRAKRQAVTDAERRYRDAIADRRQRRTRTKGR